MSSCSHKEHEEVHTIQVREVPQDVLIPEAVINRWDELKTTEPTELLGLKLLIKEKNPGVLKHSKIEFSFPAGGGSVDFKDLLEDTAGTFNLKWIDSNDAALSSTNVFFIPGYEESQVDNEKWGDSCKNLFEITNFAKKISSEGIDLNVTEFRHIRLFGGTFIFLRKNEKSLEVAQITFTDSRFSGKQCKVK